MYISSVSSISRAVGTKPTGCGRESYTGRQVEPSSLIKAPVCSRDDVSIKSHLGANAWVAQDRALRLEPESLVVSNPSPCTNSQVEQC